MKYYQTQVITIGLLIIFAACNKNYDRNAEEKTSTADTSINKNASAAITDARANDSGRKFIRNAELKFKVNSVLESTYDFEHIVNTFGGFVASTNLTSDVDQMTTTPVSVDSSVETIFYTVKNSIILRIPNAKLDTALKEISKQINYLDFRIIKSEDVSLQILSNNFMQRRLTSSAERNLDASARRRNKLSETIAAEEAITDKFELADNADISNRSLADQIQFSTINLTIYQRQSVRKEFVFNYTDVRGYEPGLGTKLLNSLQSGWQVFETVLVFIVKFWALFILLIVAWFYYRRFGKSAAV